MAVIARTVIVKMTLVTLKRTPGKGISECRECSEFPCIKATYADFRSMIHTEVHYADEITWGILPYVPWQYER